MARDEALLSPLVSVCNNCQQRGSCACGGRRLAGSCVLERGRSAQPFFIMKQKQTLHPSKGQRVSSLILPVCAQGSHRHGHALDPLVEGHGGRKGGSSNRGCP